MEVRVMPGKYKYSHWEKIAVFLLRYANFENEYVAPKDCTQMGIARVFGLSRAHVALEVKRLLDKKYVEKHLKHIVNYPTKLLTYNLTSEGWKIATQIKKMMEDDGKTLEDIIKENPKKNLSSYVSYHELFKRYAELEKRLDTLERRSR
jgi:hypothetical protein